MTGSRSKTAVVSGVGAGTGSAIVRKLTEEGYNVAMLARSAERLKLFESEIAHTLAVPCDVSIPAQVSNAIDKIRSEFGRLDVLVHNAVGGTFGNFLEIDPETLRTNFEVNTMGLLYLARSVAPDMIKAGTGSIIVTGNTSAVRGKADFAAFAPTKAAQRILAESIARNLGPKGIHVAYLVIDAVIDLPWTRKRWANESDGFFIQPKTIAEEVAHLIGQTKSGWSFLSELRPYGEVW